MARYIALIDGAPGAFGVAFPDCPGCTAMASTIDEALAQAAEALREWMADRVAAKLSPPNARTAEDIRADPAYAEDFDGEAVVATVPLLLDKGRSVKANISLDAGLLDAIDDAARLRGITRSAFFASAAREKITAER